MAIETLFFYFLYFREDFFAIARHESSIVPKIAENSNILQKHFVLEITKYSQQGYQIQL